MFEPRRLHRLTADFELVTPAFCGGADTTKAELRLPSLLGALRFWWRALAWSRTAAIEGEDQRLKKVAEWEEELFGSARQGQGRLVARLANVVLKEERPAGSGTRVAGYEPHRLRGPATRAWSRPPHGAVYLAGQGLTPYDNKQKRSLDVRNSIKEGASFSLVLTSRHGFPQNSGSGHPPTVIEAIRLLGLLGGIGSRSRRGFGSLRLKAIALDDGSRNPPPLDPPPAGIEAYKNALGVVLDQSTTDATPIEKTPYTAFNAHSRAWLVKAPSADTDIAQVHNEMGFHFLYFRGTGHGNGPQRTVAGKPKNIQNEHRFEGDHRWFGYARAATSRSQIVGVPERSIFGLPHNYFSPPHHANLKVDVTPAEEDRRASPLFLHLHRFEQGPPVAIWLHLPARFLPAADGEPLPKLKVKNHKFDVETENIFVPDWSPIERFFVKRHLPNVEKIKPGSSP